MRKKTFPKGAKEGESRFFVEEWVVYRVSYALSFRRAHARERAAQKRSEIAVKGRRDPTDIANTPLCVCVCVCV